MKLERDGNGDFILDPDLLIARFAVDAATFRRHMMLGMVTSIVENGEGEDCGRQRLTVRYGNQVWRAVIDGSLNVVNEETFVLGR